MKIYPPFYDPDKSYEENLKHGPFNAFSDRKIFVRQGKPTFELYGNKLYSPFGIPAGPLPNYKFVKAAFEKGFDVNIYKTVRTKAKSTHPNPNVLPVDITGDLTLEKAAEGLTTKDEYENPLAITNSFGVGSFDPDVWQPDMKKAVEVAGDGQLMIGSFQGTNIGKGENAYIEDHVLGARLVKETGAKVIEVNLSCPNEGTADLLCFDTDRVEKIASRVKDEIGDTPLFLKTAHYKDKTKLSSFLERLSKIVDGFSTINTIPAEIRKRDGSQALPGEGRLVSGVCGAPIKWAGVEMVDRINKYRDKSGRNFKIIGVGGVTCFDDFAAYREKGADIVMSATGAMWNPYLGQEIYKEILDQNSEPN